jgi:hypothetical protein
MSMHECMLSATTLLAEGHAKNDLSTLFKPKLAYTKEIPSLKAGVSLYSWNLQ